MNYSDARQRQSDGRWDYTTNGHPVGYCREWRDWDEVTRALSPAAYAQYVADKDKYHSHGHATEDEARECYRDYILDHQLRLNLVNSGTQSKCEICGEWTQKYAMLPFQIFKLCDLHNNREEVEKLFGTVGQIISS